MNFDADAFFISSRVLMIAQISAVKVDAESGNLIIVNDRDVTSHRDIANPIHLYHNKLVREANV